MCGRERRTKEERGGGEEKGRAMRIGKRGRKRQKRKRNRRREEEL